MNKQRYEELEYLILGLLYNGCVFRQEKLIGAPYKTRNDIVDEALKRGFTEEQVQLVMIGLESKGFIKREEKHEA
ncbi:MAG: hypothetical protein ACE5L6_02200 [Candidatus Bathyarchaeia archaeon]